jgi:hypothetical protein
MRARPMRASLGRILSGLLATLVFAAIVGRTVAKLPIVHNWDMLGYMALALEWSVADDVEVHRATYAAAEAELPRETFLYLLASDVRRERYEDAAAFHEHLPFYRARVLYTGLVALVHAAGVPLVAATHAVAVGSFVLLAGLVLLWASRALGPLAGLAFALGLVHVPPLLNTATWATADALATLTTLGALYFALERRAWRAACACMLFAILSRPDSIVLAGLFCAALALVPRIDRPSTKALLAGLALCVLAYLGVQAHAGEYGWWPLFQISFVEKTAHPAALPTAIDPALYRDVLARQLAALPGVGYFTTEEAVTGSTLVFPWCGLALAGLGLAWRHRARSSRPGLLLVRTAALAALLVALPVRWLLFPQLFDRMLAIFFVAVPLILLSLLADALAARELPVTSTSSPPSPGAGALGEGV